MNSTIVIYGSSTGTCEAIAEKIASKLGCEALNVQDLSAETVAANQNLILGTSTWGAGELQDDWYDGLKTLQGADLSGKTIAIFGCGDCSTYSDTFVGGMGELYNGIKDSGANFIGSVETDGYTFDDSEAVIDGKFIGLPLDSTTSMRTTRPIHVSMPGWQLLLQVFNHRCKFIKKTNNRPLSDFFRIFAAQINNHDNAKNNYLPAGYDGSSFAPS